MKRIAGRDARAKQRLAAIEHSVRGLNDEDLLDLADIFSSEDRGPLGDLAAAEMTKRNISL